MAGNAAAEQRRGDARRSKWAAAVPARVCQAVLAETIIPTLDGASNSPAYVTVRLAPEITRDVTPPATLPPAGPAPPVSLSSNFRLNIAGLDCTKVTKIDSFTVKPRLAGETLANGRYQDAIQAAPANLLEFPNLQIELATVSEETWRAWFRSFVIDGNSSAMNEKTGTLSFLAPNLSTVLATISFQNLGIFRLEDAPARRKRRDNARCRGALLRANGTGNRIAPARVSGGAIVDARGNSATCANELRDRERGRKECAQRSPRQSRTAGSRQPFRAGG